MSLEQLTPAIFHNAFFSYHCLVTNDNNRLKISFLSCCAWFLFLKADYLRIIMAKGEVEILGQKEKKKDDRVM